MYGIADLIKMSRDIKGQSMNRTQGLMSGKLNPWDLPEWQPQIQGMRNAGEQGLAGLSKNLSMAGVTGPANALTMERANEGINNNVLNLSNLMRNDWRSGEQEASGFVDTIQKMAQQQKQFDEQMNAQKLNSLIAELMKGGQMLAGGLTGGLMGLGGNGSMPMGTGNIPQQSGYWKW